ncbi:hypothetical protein Leryth_025344 [Lithospermum erythrorhizon]|nr:hypothetical protein Leryth_025344 [Lithospermum erythrorhizon]
MSSCGETYLCERLSHTAFVVIVRIIGGLVSNTQPDSRGKIGINVLCTPCALQLTAPDQMASNHINSISLYVLTKNIRWCCSHPSTPESWRQWRLLSESIFFFGYGLHLSYVNVAPQQARLKVRNDFVRDFLKKKYGYEPGTELGNNYKKVGPINKINYVDIVKEEISKSWLAKYWNKW